MQLHEYQVKKLFTRYGLPVPSGFTCTTSREAEEAASKIGSGPWVVKCQVYAGGRGKAGGIKVVKCKEEIRIFADKWLGKRLVTDQTDKQGKSVNYILIETATEISQELYFGITVDRSLQRIVFIASTKGGVEIEKVAKETPYMIHKIALNSLTDLKQPYLGREFAFKLGLNGKQISQFTKIFTGLSTLFLECDLVLVEINPLVLTKQGDLICLDGKLSVDENAIFRQPELREMHDPNQEDLYELRASQWKLNYVALKGNIGCMVNGAGLAMGTIDIIKHHGGKAANFLDIGGRATKEHVIKAFSIILSNKKVKAVLVNIFGGIVRCDLIADSIISSVVEVGVNIPIVVRFEGNNARLGIKKLLDSGLNIIAAHNLNNAVHCVVTAAQGNNVNSD